MPFVPGSEQQAGVDGSTGTFNSELMMREMLREQNSHVQEGVVDRLNALGAKSWHEGDWRELSCLLLELCLVLTQSTAPKQL